MGFLSLFRPNATIATHVAKSDRRQRKEVNELRALPMAAFIAQCLARMNAGDPTWRGTARPARPDAKAQVAAKRLPASLAEFYLCCDGIEGSKDFPVPVLPLAQLRLAADAATPPSQVMAAWWKQHGNDSGREGLLKVLPPQNMLPPEPETVQSFVRPSVLDMALPLVAMSATGFVLALLAPAGEHLRPGAVLEVESGVATRYDDIKHWLANWAIVFDSMKAV